MAKRGSGNISPLLFYHGPIILCVQKMAANFYECIRSDGERRERRQNRISIFAMEPLSKSFDLYPLVDMSRESSKGNGLLIAQYDYDALRFHVFTFMQ